MRVFLSLMSVLLLLPSVKAQDVDLLFISRQGGVFISEVKDGVPGPYVKKNYVVTIQGFGSGTPSPNPDPNPNPNPNPSDPETDRVANISKSVLGSSLEAMAAAAIVDALYKQGLKGADFVAMLNMSLPIGDTQLKSEGRLKKWGEQVTAPFAGNPASVDPVKIKAGLVKAFNLPATSLAGIAEAVETGEVPQSAIDFQMIITLILAILNLLSKLPGVGQ